jgi:SAM-dependent methyltransferase
MRSRKLSQKVIKDFGDEWAKFTFLEEQKISEIEEQAKRYFALLEGELKSETLGLVADFGAGTGRWSQFILKNCSKLNLVEPSQGAYQVLSMRFSGQEKARLLNERIEDCSLENDSIDIGICLGVLHHISDTESALKSINAKLKPGGTLLAYMYYNLENRNLAYKSIFRVSVLLRMFISVLPNFAKRIICEAIAFLVYLPLGRISKFLNELGIKTHNFPLHHYESLPFYVMRNDSLDRFGTRLEKRYSRDDIRHLLNQAGFDMETLVFSESEPYWTFKVKKPIELPRGTQI